MARRLPLSEKQEFDLAHAKELNQVAISGALRNLTKKELAKLDPAKVMQMRWVLTRKSTGLAKARLVVLGFQAHNLTEVATASPTMSKAGRHILLTLAAMLQMQLKSGDVTSAFLQTDESLEDQELHVWAPPELATLFGASPEDPRALRVVRAFYGLVHAPRKWWESVTSMMMKIGWTPLLGDKCVFVLMEESGTICGLAGVHVDDFLIAGREGSRVYLEAEAALQSAFRFGKWEMASEGFEFAGCFIRQKGDYSIVLDQQAYTEKFILEIPVDQGRSPKSELNQEDVMALRGALGTASWRATQSAPQFLADTSLN